MCVWEAHPLNVVIFQSLSTWRQGLSPVFSFTELQRRFSKMRGRHKEALRSYRPFPLVHSVPDSDIFW